MKAIKNLNGLRVYVAFAILVFLIFACKKDGEINTSDPNTIVATDYSQAAHWLSLPAIVYPVDVFYLYPTAWHKVNPTDPNICEIDNPSMLTGSNAAFAKQATAFETIGNIYAPYYRQDDAVFALSLPVIQRDALVAGAPTIDAMAAFDYYIKHFNKGRPFILAGHSQGSEVLRNLLSGYMKDNQAVYSKMIAAYALGTSITPAYLAANPHLHFAMIPAEGLGSYMPDSAGVFSQVPQYADARIDLAKSALICSTADKSLGFAGIFHNYDYPFYYFNLRVNAANRVQKFLNKKK